MICEINGTAAIIFQRSVSGFVFNSVPFYLVHKITTENWVGALYVPVRFIWFGVNAV